MSRYVEPPWGLTVALVLGVVVLAACGGPVDRTAVAPSSTVEQQTTTVSERDRAAHGKYLVDSV